MTGITPLFNGLPLFGPVAHVVGRATEVARVTRGFCGVNGLLTKTNGTRGATADASGAYFEDSQGDLLATEGVMEAIKLAGQPYVLLDSLGRAWPRMILVEFEPIGAILQDENGFSRDYRARFLGLTVPTF